MPPTFLVFIGLITYLGLMGITVLICLPMYLFEKQKKKALLYFLTNLISFPVLIFVGLVLTILFAIPGLGIMYLLNFLNLQSIMLVLLLLFIFFVAVSALYHWFLGHKMIANFLNRAPINNGLENDKIYSLFIKHAVNWISKKVS